MRDREQRRSDGTTWCRLLWPCRQRYFQGVILCWAVLAWEPVFPPTLKKTKRERFGTKNSLKNLWRSLVISLCCLIVPLPVETGFLMFFSEHIHLFAKTLLYQFALQVGPH